MFAPKDFKNIYISNRTPVPVEYYSRKATIALT